MVTISSPLYLLDTNILIHYARTSLLAHYIEATYALQAAATQPAISIVTVGEALAIARRNRWGAVKQRKLQDMLDKYRVISLDLPGIVDAYAELSDYTYSVGRTMGDNDLWIAATARVTGPLLLTTNKDFDHLDPAYIQRDWIDPASGLPGTP